jgi:hypothetical protein
MAWSVWASLASKVWERNDHTDVNSLPDFDGPGANGPARDCRVRAFPSPSSDYLTEVWAWNGTTWRLYSTDLPAELASATMAYDADHHVAVLHTGALGGAPGGTWVTR